MKKILCSFLFLSVFMFFSTGCNEEDNPVTPAAKLTGKYRTTKPVKVIVKTDFCTSDLQEVGYEYWTMNWEIKERSDPNQVDITMVYSKSGWTVTNSACGGGSTGYVPEPSPIFAWGYINGDVLTINYDNQNIMTVDIADLDVISGDLKYQYCMVFCQEIYTDETSFELEKL